jgi:hypothetical protein
VTLTPAQLTMADALACVLMEDLTSGEPVLPERRAEYVKAANAIAREYVQTATPKEVSTTHYQPTPTQLARMTKGIVHEIMKDYPVFEFDAARHMFAHTANPHFAWLAIEACVKHEWKLPGPLSRYLLQCAKRMRSDEAKKRDLRDVLPWVFGFSKKPGPGALLDPFRDADDRAMLAMRFAIKIEQGEKPSAALASARNATFDQERADKIKDRTLRSWVCAEFGLKKWLHTNAEWRPIVLERYMSGDAFLVDYARQVFRR